jgi:hypothetical protein
MAVDMTIKEAPKYTEPDVQYAIPTFDMGMGSCRNSKIFWNCVFPPDSAPPGFYVRHHDKSTHQTHVIGVFQSFSAAWAANASSDSFTKAVIEKLSNGNFVQAKSSKLADQSNA